MSMYGVCGDFVQNYSNGTFSINQFSAFLPVVASGNFVAAVGSLFLSRNALSNVACAIERQIGLPIVGEVVALGGLCLIGKGLQYGYERYKVQTPVQLIQAVLKDKGLPLLNPDYQKLAKTFDAVINQKVEFMLNDLRTRFPHVFDIMNAQEKREYADEVKKQAIKELPLQLENKKDDITAAVAHSQVPVAARTRAGVPGMQEGLFNAGTFDLEQALASILYGNQVANQQHTPRVRPA